MVNWHPLATIWHPFEGAGIYLHRILNVSQEKFQYFFLQGDLRFAHDFFTPTDLNYFDPPPPPQKKKLKTNKKNTKSYTTNLGHLEFTQDFPFVVFS